MRRTDCGNEQQPGRPSLALHSAAHAQAARRCAGRWRSHTPAAMEGEHMHQKPHRDTSTDDDAYAPSVRDAPGVHADRNVCRQAPVGFIRPLRPCTPTPPHPHAHPHARALALPKPLEHGILQRKALSTGPLHFACSALLAFTALGIQPKHLGAMFLAVAVPARQVGAAKHSVAGFCSSRQWEVFGNRKPNMWPGRGWPGDVNQ